MFESRRWKLENAEKIYLLGTLRYLEGCVIISRGFAAESRAWEDYFSSPACELEFFSLGTQMWSYCSDRWLLEDLKSWLPPWDRDEISREYLTSKLRGWTQKCIKAPMTFSVIVPLSLNLFRKLLLVCANFEIGMESEARISVEINRKRGLSETERCVLYFNNRYIFIRK